jgi:hypothetical protein
MRSLVCVLKVAASTNKEVEGHIPNYPNLPPQLICQLHDVTMHVRARVILSCTDFSDAALWPSLLGLFRCLLTLR